MHHTPRAHRPACTRSLALTLAAALLAPSTAPAQILSGSPASPQSPTANANPGDEQQRRRAEERRVLATEMLIEIADGAATLTLPDNRAHLRANVANALWTHDAKRARALFGEAVADLARAMPGETDADDNAFWRFRELRREVLNSIAACDPQSALDAMRQTRPAVSPATEARRRRMSGGTDDELRIEQNLVAQIARDDPAQALKLAEESLARGVTHEVFGALNSLHARDAASAAKLRDMIAAKLLTIDFNKSNEAAQVAHQMLQAGAQVTAARRSSTSSEGHPPVLDATTSRDLVARLAAAALATEGNGNQLLWTLRSLPAEVLGTLPPARAAQLRRRLETIDAVSDPNTRAYQRYQQIINTGNARDIAAAAAQAPAGARGMLYQQAAMKALHQESDIERARAIVAEHFPADHAERENLMRQIDNYDVHKRLSNGDLREARAAVDRLPNQSERINALVNLAARANDKGDKVFARDLLLEIETLTDARPRSPEALHARLALASVYAAVDAEHARGISGALIERANEMFQAASVLGGFATGGESFSGDELVLRGHTPMNSLLNLFAQHFAALARHDLESARTLADSFMRPEARLAAKLAIAQTVFNEQPQGSNQNVGARRFSGIQFGSGMGLSPRRSGNR